MSSIKFYQGSYTELQQKDIETGSLYLITDTGEIYLDYGAKRYPLGNADKILDIDDYSIPYNKLQGIPLGLNNKIEDYTLSYNQIHSMPLPIYDKTPDDNSIDYSKLSGLIFPINDINDTIIHTGYFKNQGMGWNSYYFPIEYSFSPIIIAQCNNEYDVIIKNITTKGFIYKLVQSTNDFLTNSDTNNLSVTTTTWYTAVDANKNSYPTVYTLLSGNWTEPINVVTDISHNDQFIQKDYRLTDSPEEIRYIAFESVEEGGLF